jgi:3-phosphoshikimate 1-carboxyvinyltransferase
MSEIHPPVIRIPAVRRPFDAVVRIPGSKSITNRALPMAAMAKGKSTLTGVLFADDTRHMIAALQQLGFELSVDETARTIQIRGGAGQIPAATTKLFCGNSGTTIRFLTAICSASSGAHKLDGVERMRQRPIGELAEALQALGGSVKWPGRTGFPPIQVGGTGLAGGACRFADVQSSQFISAVLMAAPLARGPVEVILGSPVTSEPYIRMTLAMMEHFGVGCTMIAESGSSRESRTIRVPAPRTYQARDYAIEPDASNASYFLAAAALVPGASVLIRGLGRDSLQGDVLFADVLNQMGAELVMHADEIRITGRRKLSGLTINMNGIPDMVQTLAVLALFADQPTRILNVGNLRVKETDRLGALEAELRKLGAGVTTTADSITIIPPARVIPARIKTYDDHRMAMAFAVAGLRVDGVEIENPQCTAKTYPEFFTDFLSATAFKS